MSRRRDPLGARQGPALLKLPAESESALAERARVWKDQTADDLLDLAYSHLDQATVIGYGKTPVPEPGIAVRQRDLDQCADDLKLAAEHGPQDLGKLKSHPAFPLLLARDDVQLALKSCHLLDEATGEKQVKKTNKP